MSREPDVDPIEDTAFYLSRCDYPCCWEEGTEPYRDGYVCMTHFQLLADQAYERLKEAKYG